jgi:hypothetical protein
VVEAAVGWFGHGSGNNFIELREAVKNYVATVGKPEPLPARLARLQSGATVDSDGPYTPYKVVGNYAVHRELVCEWNDGTATRLALVPYHHVTAILSESP